ncbi:MAG: sigma-54 dependent transcriptional regulator [Myxococcota bacterium]|jgi:two-component system response regulator FlrC|nr:sigma-54 dependent transcriptional regulator [Myxococcota bacterium]
MSRVLVFERSPGLLHDLVQVLERAGYSTLAVDSTDALEQCLDDHGCRAALVDVRGETDVVWLDRLLRSAPAPIVFAMGASGSVELAVTSMKLGVRDYFRKPFRVEQLERRLSRELHQVPLVNHPVLAAEDERMTAMLREARAAAGGDTTVVIRGERGSGKKAIAEWIHAASARGTGPLVRVDCGSLRDATLDAEVFGREAGAWLEAPQASSGFVERANQGTLLLEDIDEASPAAQAIFVRLLEERGVKPVGASFAQPVDVRIMATTSRDLREFVEQGEFREDLYYRLDVVSLEVPPLRERTRDLRMLAEAMLRKHVRALGSEAPVFADDDFDALSNHPFPGNLRELDNLMQRAAVLFPGSAVEVERLMQGPGNLAAPPQPTPASSLNLRELERQAVERSLREANGNRTHASQLLGINVRTLRNKIRLYGLR